MIYSLGHLYFDIFMSLSFALTHIRELSGLICSWSHWFLFLHVSGSFFSVSVSCLLSSKPRTVVICRLLTVYFFFLSETQIPHWHVIDTTHVHIATSTSLWQLSSTGVKLGFGGWRSGVRHLLALTRVLRMYSSVYLLHGVSGFDNMEIKLVCCVCVPVLGDFEYPEVVLIWKCFLSVKAISIYFDSFLLKACSTAETHKTTPNRNK